ncbi:MAG: hypothetical protein QOI80_2337, partial [Solirubrobacteraceae bacterium]|nr:hypothetical protein [Solirubrobacteraceae bacterium]
MEDELFEMYDEGLRRILAVVGEEQRAELAEDGVVASVLLAHGLYPVPLEDRVREALEEVRPYLESHAGGIELLGVEDGIARLRMKGSCDGCSASFATLEAAVEQALRAHAPDLEGMDVEGAVAAPPDRPPPSSPEWVALPVDPARGEVASARGLMVANVAGTLLAYRDWCAGCPAPLSSGMLIGGTLTCTACGRSYDLPRAGREKDGELQLEPVPLLRSGGHVKVSVPAGDEDASSEHGREGHCELCPVGLSERHQHLLNLVERRIVCVCATCWSLHSGDPEYRATGGRTLWLDDFALDAEAWSAFQ